MAGLTRKRNDDNSLVMPFGVWKKNQQPVTLEEKITRLVNRMKDAEDLQSLAESLTREDFTSILADLAEKTKTVPGCAIRAERILGKMERLAAAIYDELPNHYFRLVPDTECYRLVIQAWADSRSENPVLIATRASIWLNKHMDSPLDIQRPDTATVNTFLDAVSRGRKPRSAGNIDTQTILKKHAMLAQETLNMMIEDKKKFPATTRMAPNIDSFNFVLRAWTRCRKLPTVDEHAMDVLDSIRAYQQDCDPSIIPNRKSYGLVLDSLNCRIIGKLKNYRDKENPLENGLSEIDTMTSIIQIMHEQGDPIRPITVTYNILISAWSHMARLHAEEAPVMAERVLQEMTRYVDQGREELRPDARTYALIIRAWLNSRLPQSTSRVAWWLETQWKDYEFDNHPERRPTTECYNMVIRAFAEVGDAPKAEEYLRSMMNEDRWVKQDSESFAFIIKVWSTVAAQESDLNALKKAHHWFKHVEMLEQSSDDSVRTSPQFYLQIISAARGVAPYFPMESLAVAYDMLTRMEQSHHPLDPLAYARILQVGLLAFSKAEYDSVRATFIRRMVEKCSEAGLISGIFVRSIAKGMVYCDGWTTEESERIRKEVFQWPFPPSWTRNIKDPNLLPLRDDLYRDYTYLTRHGWTPYWKNEGSNYCE
jgi:pentatricopeptide repeat protein